MHNQFNFHKTVGEIVAEDIRHSSVLKRFEIDFCCGGQRKLIDICAEKNLDLHMVLEQLTEIKEAAVLPSQNYSSWNMGFLIEYLVNTHHKYVIKTMPELLFYLSKIAIVHGDNHPELKKVEFLFKQVMDDLRQHLITEEEQLFPAMKVLLKEKGDFILREVKEVLVSIHEEHEVVGSLFKKMNELTNNFTLPSDACRTYEVAFKMLKEFEDDLHIHVHLENNILFKRVLA